MKGANSTEFDDSTSYPVIDLLPEQKKIKDMGGTMRLGNWPCQLEPRTLARKVYGKDKKDHADNIFGIDSLYSFHKRFFDKVCTSWIDLHSLLYVLYAYSDKNS